MFTSFSSKSVWNALAGALFSTLFLLGQQCHAQKQPAAAPKPSSEVQIFRLRAAEANQAASALEQLIPSDRVRLVADPKTNTLIVTGDRKSVEEVSAVLEQLDRPAAKNESSFVLIPLRRKPDKGLISIVDMLADTSNARIAVDENRRLLVVNGPEKAQQSIADLVRELDRAQAVIDRPSNLRVVWMVSKQEDAPVLSEVPADLKPVLLSLAKLGIDDLGMVTQALVNVSASDEQFEVRGSASLDGPVEFQVQGQLEEDPKASSKVQIQIEASQLLTINPGDPAQFRGRGPTQKPLASIMATVQLSAGQFVVLGVTPLGDRNSVFVVQLTD